MPVCKTLFEFAAVYGKITLVLVNMTQTHYISFPLPCVMCLMWCIHGVCAFLILSVILYVICVIEIAFYRVNWFRPLHH